MIDRESAWCLLTVFLCLLQTIEAALFASQRKQSKERKRVKGVVAQTSTKFLKMFQMGRLS